MDAAESQHRFLGMSFYDMRGLVEGRLGCAMPVTWEQDLVASVAAVMAVEAAEIPGAREAIDAVEALGLSWCVASNSSHEEMEAKFTCTGLWTRVAGKLHSSVDVIAVGGRGKPAPDLFLSAARAAETAPEACLVVEDSVLGARAAAAAGMACWALCPNGAAASLVAEGAVPFRSLAEFPALLRAEIERRGRP